MSDKQKKLLIIAACIIGCLFIMTIVGKVLAVIFALAACVGAYLFIMKAIKKDETIK